MGMAGNQDATAPIGDGGLDRGVRADRGVSDLYAGGIAAELNTITEVAPDNASTDQVISPRWT